MKKMYEFLSKSEQKTAKTAQKFSKLLKMGDIVLLEGEMGAGKTVFAKGLIFAITKNKNASSPTFTLMNEYDGELPIYHFDFWRLNDMAELSAVGAEEYLFGKGVSIVEWPDRLNCKFENAYLIRFTKISETERKIEVFGGCYEHTGI